MTEAQFQSAVIDLAVTLGWRVHHARTVQNAAGRYMTAIQGHPGFPDLVLAHRQHGVLYAELKSTQGRLSEHQKQWRALLEPTGRYRLWRPDDWNTITATLTGTATHDHQNRPI